MKEKKIKERLGFGKNIIRTIHCTSKGIRIKELIGELWDIHVL